MEYVNFGRAGVKVSPLALGLGLRGQSDANDAQRLIEHAIDSGINLIDCANIYGLMDDRANTGRSEEVLGKAIQGKRDDVVITSEGFQPDRSRVPTIAVCHDSILCGKWSVLYRVSIPIILMFISSTRLMKRLRRRRRSGQWTIWCVRARYAISAVVIIKHGRRARHSGSPIGLTQRPICVFRTCIIC